LYADHSAARASRYFAADRASQAGASPARAPDGKKRPVIASVVMVLHPRIAPLIAPPLQRTDDPDGRPLLDILLDRPGDINRGFWCCRWAIPGFVRTFRHRICEIARKNSSPNSRRTAPMSRCLVRAIIVVAVIVFAGVVLHRTNRAIDCLTQVNAELIKANTQLDLANRHIAEMHVRLADTSRKLDETNANLTLTNNKFVALDQVFQKLTLFRR
jgi:hypothetical protein